jgi:hypothetical protein
MSQRSLAVINYESAFGFFPRFDGITSADVSHPFSWRVAILPQYEEFVLVNKYEYDEPWNGLNNSQLHSTILRAYKCASNPSQESPQTDVVAIIGEMTMWHPTKTITSHDIVSKSRTLMFMETRESGIHWMEPRDFAVDDLFDSKSGHARLGSHHAGGTIVGRANGSVGFSSSETDPVVLRQFLDRTAGSN